MSKKQFRKLALGGTFDLIHKGHEELFVKAFELGEEIIIGVTSDEFVQELYKDHSINEYEFRKNYLLEFIKKITSEDRYIIVTLDDPYGPTIHDKSIEAILVSKESEKTVDIINKIRIDNGFRSLKIMSIELTLDSKLAPGMPYKATWDVIMATPLASISARGGGPPDRSWCAWRLSRRKSLWVIFDKSELLEFTVVDDPTRLIRGE